jgi:glycosyltransferase involved in cell wall biosynthesis
MPKPVVTDNNSFKNKSPRLLLLITEDWYYWTHRRSIALGALKTGYTVSLATRVHSLSREIADDGIKLIPISLRRRSRNPFREAGSILELYRIYKREKPTIVHHVTLKPVLYGSIAAWLAGVPAVVNALAGLGHAFVSNDLKTRLFRKVLVFGYRFVLGLGNSRVIFQNPEDLSLFVKHRIVPESKAVLIRGAGADGSVFQYQPEMPGVPVVMFAGRLLWNKGVKELVEAGKLLKSEGISHRIVLVGTPDKENPRAIPIETLEKWHNEGSAEWWGPRKSENMPDVIAQASIVALPTTYGEGVPKVLIEAASVGRAIVATDVPGCREIVHNNTNGLLIPPNDVLALKAAIASLLSNKEKRDEMGKRGREIVTAQFSQDSVVEKTLAVYNGLFSHRHSDK